MSRNYVFTLLVLSSCTCEFNITSANYTNNLLLIFYYTNNCNKIHIINESDNK